jgi:hypothetical protein
MNNPNLDEYLAKYSGMEVRLPTMQVIKTLPAQHLREMFRDVVGLPEGELSKWCQSYMDKIDNIKLGNIYHGLILSVENDLYVLSVRPGANAIQVNRWHISKEDVLMAYCMILMIKQRIHAFCNRTIAMNATRMLTRQEQYYGRALYPKMQQGRVAA